MTDKYSNKFKDSKLNGNSNLKLKSNSNLQELKKKGIPVVLLHPGFNRTGMTAKYSHIWDKEGAVEPKVRYSL
jgi:hypothetical protein